jgi:hypothetical protein
VADVRERWFIDDFELTQGYVREVEYRQGLYTTAELQGDNGQVPQRAGEVWRPKRRGAVGFAVNMWVAGEDRTEVERLYADVLQAIGDGTRLPLWRRHLANGTVRQTEAEVVGVITPTPVGNVAMRLSLEARAPAGVWEATVDAEQQTTARPGTGTVLDMVNFGDDITAPLDQLVYVITGPATNPEVVDATVGAGDSFRYAGTVPAGATLTINSETWGINGSGFTPDRGAFYHTGPRFMTLRTPMPRQYPRCRFNYANGGATTRLRVYGRPVYAA